MHTCAYNSNFTSTPHMKSYIYYNIDTPPLNPSCVVVVVVVVVVIILKLSFQLIKETKQNKHHLYNKVMLNVEGLPCTVNT